MPLIGNRVIEKDLREHLQSQGYWGRSAEFHSLELAAIGRPGWLQVFRFDVRAKNQSTEAWSEIYGVCRDDERYEQLDVVLCESAPERDVQLQQWSEGLISHQRDRRHWLHYVLMSLFAAIAMLIAIAAAVRTFT